MIITEQLAEKSVTEEASRRISSAARASIGRGTLVSEGWR